MCIEGMVEVVAFAFGVLAFGILASASAFEVSIDLEFEIVRIVH